MKHSLSTSEFKIVFIKSKSLQVGDLLFKYKRDNKPKLGLIVSKKYGNAIHRNLFKRQCRSCFQQLCKNEFQYSLIIKPLKKNILWNDILISFQKLKQKIND